MSLSGLVLIRNGLSLDYCFQEAIQSLLPVCDEVVVSDGESNDGTQELIREWMLREPKLKLCVYPWPHPKGDIEFYVRWIQHGRQHCRSTHVCHLDADEILDERSYRHVRRYTKFGQRYSLKCHRLNYWRDPKHLVPHGVCLGHEVVRLCPQDVFLPSDGAHPLGAECVVMSVPSPIVIHHYGFLRRPDAYFAKSRQLHDFFFAGYDQRLADVETATLTLGVKNWMESIKNVDWIDRLLPYAGPHPKLAHPWLRARGMEP